MFELHRLGLGKMLVALRHIQTIEPRFFRRLRVVKEQQIGGDAGIGGKDTARQTDNGMQVAARLKRTA